MSKQTFEEILCDAVAKVFLSLGDSVMQAICKFLATDYRIDIPDVPHRPKDFDNAIVALLGEGGKFVEEMILKELQAKIGYPLRSHGEQLSFGQRVESAAKFYRSGLDKVSVSGS